MFFRNLFFFIAVVSPCDAMKGCVEGRETIQNLKIQKTRVALVTDL